MPPPKAPLRASQYSFAAKTERLHPKPQAPRASLGEDGSAAGRVR